MKINLKANELVMKATDSDFYINDNEKVKGKLILTNQRIYFKSINGYTGEHDLEIDPKAIRDVIFFNTWVVLRNGLNLILNQGKEFRFLIKNRDHIGSMIARMC